jgi:hypothetical protein
VEQVLDGRLLLRDLGAQGIDLGRLLLTRSITAPGPAWSAVLAVAPGGLPRSPEVVHLCSRKMVQVGNGHRHSDRD